MTRGIPFLLFASVLGAQQTPAPPEPKPEPNRRVELNLLGQTDTAAGESRRNENVQFNLIDNNALKELHVRLGASATIVREFRPENGYFSTEFGNAPTAPPHLAPVSGKDIHGRLFATHQNSVFAARSFFQVGGVKPARENQYGVNLGLPGWRGAFLTFEAAQQKLRGSVNGNVLVPRADERTALAADPATRALVQHFLNAYPDELPNRTDINPRALNTNAPQVIDNDTAGARLDLPRGRDRFALRYLYTAQHVEAFQLVAGQTPNTDTRAHTARATWVRQWSSGTVAEFTVGYDRIASLLLPEPNAVGPMVSTSGLETLGPLSAIPIDRAQNLFRYGGQFRKGASVHQWTAGFHLLRRQLNGTESDTHRGYFSFGSDFGRDGITNLRLGTPNQHIVALGNVSRGFRNWDMQFYAGDTWKARPGLTLHYGVRWQPVTRPTEVNGFNDIPYGTDWNNVAPYFGFARTLPGAWGVVRANYGVEYGEIYPVTFQQVRFTPPWNHKIVVMAPSLLNPLASVPAARSNLYLLDPELATPYEHHYNLSWERELAGGWHLQLGYVGSRGHKLLSMWYLNRGQSVAGIPLTTATINERRADQRYADVRLVINGSRGYYDAARATLAVPRWRGLSLDASYWFSKALDLGSSFTNTAFDGDSRLGRSQSEFESHRDMKGLSPFDQPHAFLWRAGYALPAFSRIFGGWTISAITLLKSGTPFNVITGSDGPGFGNVDGNGGDRPNLLDKSVLGRTIGDPDTSARLLPRTAFAFIQPGEQAGSLGRNTFRKGGIRNVNAALSRTWTVRGEKRVDFRAESINFFNTPQFAEPGAELVSPNFGQITNTLNDGRAFRLTLGLAF
ncbi:MAG TPA: hypothetical protein VN442_08430 [Bryobacteraceae bacterium]|nr:hypothetical protein [Bryobacteraceae bacterium]